MLKRIGALLKIIAPLSDPPLEKMHGLKTWSPPGIEPGSMALNAIALTARPRRPIAASADPSSISRRTNLSTLLCVFLFGAGSYEQ